MRRNKMFKKIKKSPGIIVFTVLALTLAFMIMDSIPLPLHASITCGQGICICGCWGMGCSCTLGEWGCWCYCIWMGSYDECFNPGHGPEDIPPLPKT